MNPPINPTNAEIHVVVGAGTTGSATARRLAADGTSVRVISRSGNGPVHPLIELIAADASDATVLQHHTADASVIYNCANPPYHRWTTDWPPLSSSLLAAAKASGAVLVTLSNLYGYAPPTAPMNATDPLDATSVKGGVRAAMWHEALAAHEAGSVRITEARASDFIGADVGESGHMGDRVVPRLLVGKSVSLLGSLDAPHSWTAIDDVARTLITLGHEPQAWGKAWHVPTAAPMTQREIVQRMCDLAGVDRVSIKTLPSFALTLAGFFSPMIRELKEVVYQFEEPFVIDAAATTEAFGLEPTPIDETLLASLGSYSPKSQTIAIS